MEKLKLEQAREKALNLLRSIEIESDPLETSMQDVTEALSDIKELKDDDDDEDDSFSRISSTKPLYKPRKKPPQSVIDKLRSRPESKRIYEVPPADFKELKSRD